jgi:hypothetical protein
MAFRGKIQLGVDFSSCRRNGDSSERIDRCWLGRAGKSQNRDIVRDDWGAHEGPVARLVPSGAERSARRDFVKGRVFAGDASKYWHVGGKASVRSLTSSDQGVLRRSNASSGTRTVFGSGDERALCRVPGELARIGDAGGRRRDLTLRNRKGFGTPDGWGPSAKH